MVLLSHKYIKATLTFKFVLEARACSYVFVLLLAIIVYSLIFHCCLCLCVKSYQTKGECPESHIIGPQSML